MLIVVHIVYPLKVGLFLVWQLLAFLEDLNIFKVCAMWCAGPVVVIRGLLTVFLIILLIAGKKIYTSKVVCHFFN